MQEVGQSSVLDVKSENELIYMLVFILCYDAKYLQMKSTGTETIFKPGTGLCVYVRLQ